MCATLKLRSVINKMKQANGMMFFYSLVFFFIFFYVQNIFFMYTHIYFMDIFFSLYFFIFENISVSGNKTNIYEIDNFIFGYLFNHINCTRLRLING